MTHKTSTITIETAALDDCSALAVMNRQLIDDEGNGNTMTVSELENRMRDWLQKGIYTGYLFRINDITIGYALVDVSEMWVRHFFICREHRRRGYGRTAVGLLFEQLGVEEIGLSCLTNNAPGQAFWRSFNNEADSTKLSIRKPNGNSNTPKPVKEKAEVMIREVEEKDYPALLTIMNNEIGSHYAAVDDIAPHYNRVKDDERYHTFVALVEDEVVGFASTVQFFTVGLDGNLMWIVQIAVKKEMQNKGVGTKLLQHIENCARERGCNSIVLNSGVRRIDAHAFYKRNGYNTDSNSWCFNKNI